MPLFVNVPIPVMQQKGASDHNAASKCLCRFSALFAHAVALEEFDGASVPI